jgi:hypothetical protein
MLIRKSLFKMIGKENLSSWIQIKRNAVVKGQSWHHQTRASLRFTHQFSKRTRDRMLGQQQQAINKSEMVKTRRTKFYQFYQQGTPIFYWHYSVTTCKISRWNSQRQGMLDELFSERSHLWSCWKLWTVVSIFITNGKDSIENQNQMIYEVFYN